MAKGTYLEGIKPYIEQILRNAFKENHDISNKNALDLVNKALENKVNRTVSQSSIAPIMKDIREKYQNGELDTPLDKEWSIGAFEIESNDLKLLIEYKRISPRPLSIRKARWMARLLPLIKELVKNIPELNENINLQYGYWSRIADIYTEREQLFEFVNRPPVTLDLDNYIFISEYQSIKELDEALLKLISIWTEIMNKDGE